MATETLTTPVSAPPVVPATPRRQGWRLKVEHGVYVALLAVLTYLIGAPIFYILWGTFFEGGSFTLDAFGRAFGAEGTLETLWNTVAFSLGSAAIAVVFGTALAYIQARTDFPLKGLLFAVSLMPLVLPPVVYAIAWVFLYGGDAGIISGFFYQIFGSSPVDAYGLGGMIVANGLHIVPIVFLFMVPAFRSMDPSLEEAARVSGAGWLTVQWRINLPLIRPALASSAVTVLVLGIEAFEVPVILGEARGLEVFTSQIYFMVNGYPSDIGAAGAVSIAIMALAVLLIYSTGAGGGSKREFQTMTGKAFRPAPSKLGKSKPWVVAGVLAYFLIAIVLPLLVLVYVSLSPYFQSPTLDALGAMNLDNYLSLAAVPGIWEATLNTIGVALAAATLAMVLTGLAGWFVTRTNWFGRKYLEMLTLAPLVIPGLVLGLGMLSVYLRSPIPIYGTLVLLVVAYITRFLTYGMRYASTAMSQIGSELEEAAKVGGSSWWTSMRRIVLPLAAPGILSGFIFILLVSFRELSSTVLLAGPNSQVLSVFLFRTYNDGAFGLVAALSVAMVVILSVLIVLAFRLGSRFGTKIDL
jgi:iron(III) transport system permease protein